MNDCKNCAKIFCEKRDGIKNCNTKITFIQANLLETPVKIKTVYPSYGGITMEEACRNIQRNTAFFAKALGGIENE